MGIGDRQHSAVLTPGYSKAKLRLLLEDSQWSGGVPAPADVGTGIKFSGKFQMCLQFAFYILYAANEMTTGVARAQHHNFVSDTRDRL